MASRRIGIRCLILVSLLGAPAPADSATAAESTLPEFGRCLREHGLRTTSEVVFGRVDRLVLPSRLPPQAAMDRAFTACRRLVRWPDDFVKVASIVYRLRDRAVRYRACMQNVGRDPGPPVVFLGDIGVGMYFRNQRPSDRPPPRMCARLLPRR
jgi:hypothetical protein